MVIRCYTTAKVQHATAAPGTEHHPSTSTQARLCSKMAQILPLKSIEHRLAMPSKANVTIQGSKQNPGSRKLGQALLSSCYARRHQKCLRDLRHITVP
jgi:hypothetical protein